MKNEITTIESNVNDKVLIEYLDVMGISPKLEEKEKIQFLNIAKTFGLNPFKREIFCTVYGTGEYKQLSIITGYEVYIKRAERSGQLDGWHATTTGSVATNDLKAIVTIYRKDRQHPFIWEVFYDECVQKTKAGAVTKFWEKANFMTKKVAISQAFRLCFSDELGGMPYTSDEMPQQEVTQDIPHVEVIEVIEPEVIKVPKLNDKQMEKLLTSDIAVIEKYLNLIEECKLTATAVQVLQLEDKLTELRNN
jgi:phage recombination protein Bet